LKQFFQLRRFLIKTPHMQEYILAIQNLLVVICISYKQQHQHHQQNQKINKILFFFAFDFIFLRLIKQWSLLQSRTCFCRKNIISVDFVAKCVIVFFRGWVRTFYLQSWFQIYERWNQYFLVHLVHRNQIAV
jgi:hypothetical protein